MIKLNQLPSLNALKAFVAVAGHGSVSLAAEQLHVTHGAVSRQVRLLEEELAIKLIQRYGRGIKLTAAGEQLYHSCQPALQAIADSCQQLRQQQQQQPLILACSGSILARWLIPRLQSLQQALPDLPLQLVTSAGDDNPQQQADLILAFVESPQPDELLVPLEQERIGPVLAPQLAGQLALSNPQQLLQHELLHTSSRPQAWPEWARHNNMAPEQLHMGQGFPHLSHLLEAVATGLGIGIAPQLLLHSDLQQGRLVAPLGFITTDSWLCLQVRNQSKQQLTSAVIKYLSQ